MSIALFDCPHCIDEFAFDRQKIAKLTYGWRVRCPGCGNIVEIVMLAYTLIHGCDPDSTLLAAIAIGLWIMTARTTHTV